MAIWILSTQGLMIVNARPDYQTNRVAAEAVEEVIWVAPTAEA